MTLPSADVSLSQLVGVDPSAVYWDLASLPLSLSGFGLRSATLMTRPPCWSSRADSLGIRQCPPTPCTLSTTTIPFTWRACGPQLAAVGFHAPSWEELAHGARTEPVVWDADFDPGIPRHGWQRSATVPVHGHLVESSV